ncbi:MAG: toxin-antitoxin system YwqK family antitoxin, partial [Flavobacterium psychrophilum]
HYKNGINEGESIEYYPDGKLKEKGTFKDDLATGTWEYYDSNGNLSRKEPYLGGELNGKVEYFSNGKNTGSQLFRSGIPVD